MKKILSVFCLLFSLLPLVSCGNVPAEQGEKERFSPLFRFAAEEGRARETRLFYLPKSRGFLYLHADPAGGITGGFVSPDRSVSSERIFQSDASLDSVTVWEDSADRAHVLTERELFTLLLKERGAHRTALPEGFSVKGALSTDPLSFITEKDGLLLMHPVDLKETYVLAQTALLPDFAGLICGSDTGKKLWYARTDGNGAYRGIAFFEYGSNTPLGTEDFPFDSFLPVGSSAVLFTRNLEDGGALYLYRDLESGATRSLLCDTPQDGVICDPEGKLLCGTRAVGEGSEVSFFDLEKGVLLSTHPFEVGAPSPSLAFDPADEALLLALGDGKDVILGLLSFEKESNQRKLQSEH